MFNKQTHILEL